MNESVLTRSSGREIRELCRSGRYDRPTAGIALGYTQVNLVILRAEAAKEFEAFCRANPKPCPLLEMTTPGDYEPKRMAPGGDVRTDLPRYRVFRNVECFDRPTSIVQYWSDDPPASPLTEGGTRGVASPLDKSGQRGVAAPSDFVAFLIGCSFSFETALFKSGIPVRHIEEDKNVPMYRTNIPCTPAGRFHGPMVVSMRPMTPAQAALAARITAAFPRVHGAPIHTGDPTAIGIANVNRPDYGDAVTIHPGEVPVFWACGVTPMEAILRAKPDIAITHEPGHMLVTDIRDESLREPPLGGAA